nr:cephalotocin receptor 2-like [Parasteatoda tepidariorum]
MNFKQQLKDEPNLPDLSLPESIHERICNVTTLKKSRLRMLKVITILLVTFICCRTPYVVIELWHLFYPNSAEVTYSRVRTYVRIFVASNSCINPLVYGIFLFGPQVLFTKLLPCIRTREHTEATFITRSTQMDDSGMSPRNSHQECEEIELREAAPVKRYRNRELPNMSHSRSRTYSEYD